MTTQPVAENKERSEDMALKVGAKALHEARRAAVENDLRYVLSFVDPKTGLHRKEYLEQRSCPVCHSTDQAPMFIKNGGTYVRCTQCSMSYLNPVFTDAALTQFYVNNADSQSEVTNKESEFARRIYGKGLASIEKKIAPGEILDVGCSAGFFLDMARERGWKTTGIELNRKEGAVAKAAGHRIFSVPLEQADLGQTFDAITFWDVIEHVKDGEKQLQTLQKYLSPQGLLFLQTPTVESLAARIMHEKCNVFDGIAHVNLYSPRTIKRLAENTGFEVLEIESVISEIPVINNYLHYEDPYYGSVPTMNSILQLIDEQQLHAHHLGYKMQLILRKK